MTEEERKAFAKMLILEAVEEIEAITIHEVFYAEHDAEISEADAEAVDDLIRSAKVTVTW